MPVGRPTLLDRGTSLPRALNGRALGKAGEYWKSPLLRVAVRQEASTAGRSSFGPPSLLAFQQLCADGIDERRAAAEYLRCSATASSEEIDRQESRFIRELVSFFGEWFRIARRHTGTPGEHGWATQQSIGRALLQSMDGKSDELLAK